MKDLLSNEEIDTLLELFRAEGVGLAEKEVGELREAVSEVLEAGTAVSPVDLLKPNRFTRDQLDAVERFLSSTASGLAAQLAEKLRVDLICDCVGVEQQRFGDWQAHLGSVASIYVLTLPPFEVPALLTLSDALLHGAVDRILGGSGRLEDPLPPATDAVHSVAESFVGPLVERIWQSLGELAQFAGRPSRRLASQAMAQIVGPNDVVLSVYFQVSGESVNGDLRMVLPFALAEQLTGRLAHGRTPEYDAAPGAMREVVRAGVGEVVMEVGAVLGRTELSLRDLLALAPGDVLTTDRQVGEDLEITVEGVARLRGELGRRGRQRAVRIGPWIERAGT